MIIPEKRSSQTSFIRIFFILVVGGAIHVALWLLATQISCESVGLGATVCDGGLGIGGSIAAFIAAFVGVPIVVWLFFKHVHQPNAGSIAWGAQVIALPVMLILFQPLFRSDAAGATLLWEEVTQLLVVPVAGLVLAQLLHKHAAS